MLDEPDAYRKNGRVYRHLLNSNMLTIICLHVYTWYSTIRMTFLSQTHAHDSHSKLRCDKNALQINLCPVILQVYM